MTTQADTVVLRVTTAATTHALAGVLAVLHSRGAALRHLSWSSGGIHDACEETATAVIEVSIDHGRQHHLCESIRRRIDVMAVHRD